MQAAIVEAARFLGWRVAHFRPAQNARGNWRTPVAADGKGFPDLILAKWPDKVLVIECKSDRGRLSPEQVDWMYAFGKRATVVRPRDWSTGRVERMLRSGQVEE